MAVEVAGAGAPGGPGRITRIVDWLKGVRVELKKVTWPDGWSRCSDKNLEVRESGIGNRESSSSH